MVGVTGLISAILTIPLVKKFPLKKLLFTGTLILCLCLLGVSISAYVDGSSAPSLPYFIFLYRIFFGCTLGALVWVYVGTVLPDLGASIAVAVLWLSAFSIA